MQNLPHHYTVTATANTEDNVRLSSTGLVDLESAPPVEFGGPGDLWSPETLLAAAVADCFILSFRAVARASKLEWESLTCDVDATLDKVEKATRFTELTQRVTLTVPAGTDEAKAMRLLEKAEHICLITNSLNAETHLEAEIQVLA